MFNDTRISEYNGMARNITINKTIGGNHHVITDSYVSTNGGINADVDFISYSWITLSFAPIFLPYSCSLVYVTIVAYNGHSVYRYAESMSNIQSISDFASHSISIPRLRRRYL